MRVCYCIANKNEIEALLTKLHCGKHQSLRKNIKKWLKQKWRKREDASKKPQSVALPCLWELC